MRDAKENNSNYLHQTSKIIADVTACVQQQRPEVVKQK